MKLQRIIIHKRLWNQPASSQLLFVDDCRFFTKDLLQDIIKCRWSWTFWFLVHQQLSSFSILLFILFSCGREKSLCMRRCLRHILLLLLLAVFTSSMAQEEEYLSDSVATLAPPLQMQQENSGFMPVTALSPVSVRKVSPAKLTELKNDDAYWYANLEPRKKGKEKKQQQPSSNKIENDDCCFLRRICYKVL